MKRKESDTLFKREVCSRCAKKISSSDINDGIARKINGKFYCRKCILDLGLLQQRGSETDDFIEGINKAFGNGALTPQETILVERKTRQQVALALEKIIKDIEAHPSWEREDVMKYLNGIR